MNQQELKKLKEERYEQIKLRLDKQAFNCKHVMVYGGSGCHSAKSKDIIDELRKMIHDEKLDNVEIIQTGCFGLCTKGPIVLVQPDDTFYSHVKIKDVHDIVSLHLKENRIVERLLVTEPDGKVVEKLADLSFNKKQKIVVLKNYGIIDPEQIDDYIALDGYKALEKCLFTIQPEGVMKNDKRFRIKRSWWCRFLYWIKVGNMCEGQW